jgi:hypothetical protein
MVVRCRPGTRFLPEATGTPDQRRTTPLRYRAASRPGNAKLSARVLKAYIIDPAAYVYWSTPRLTDAIAAGDLAFIHCTVDNQDCGRTRGQLPPSTPRMV